MLFFKKNARVKPAEAASTASLQCRCFACCHHAAKAPNNQGSKLGWAKAYLGIRPMSFPPR